MTASKIWERTNAKLMELLEIQLWEIQLWEIQQWMLRVVLVSTCCEVRPPQIILHRKAIKGMSKNQYQNNYPDQSRE